MAIFATTAFGHFGDFAFCNVLSFWEDDELIDHHILSHSAGGGDQGWSVFGYNISVSITPDGEYACVTPGQGYRDEFNARPARVYNIKAGTYVEVLLLANKEKHGPNMGVVSWSPRGCFVSGFGDYAYDPYNDRGFELPGPSAAALQPGVYGEDPDFTIGYSGFSVLATQGLLVEAKPLNVPDNSWDYPLVVKDLFTGQVVTAPASMVDTLGQAQRPCAWIDTNTIGLSYRKYDCSDPKRPDHARTKIINTVTDFAAYLPYNSRPSMGNRTVNGNLFLKRYLQWSPDNPFSPTPEYVIIGDDGTMKDVPHRANLPDLFTGALSVNICFEANKYLHTYYDGFAWYGLAGQSIPGILPPFVDFSNSYELWAPFVPNAILNVQTVTVYHKPVAQDGFFWTNRRYANETIIYE